MSTKRLFFGFSIEAPWPDIPLGRLIAPHLRHMTAAFLGNLSFETLEEHLSTLPLPSFKVGFTGFFDQCLFLPEHHPHVVAWHAQFPKKDFCEKYVLQLNTWLNQRNIATDLKLPWLPHVTLAREPFSKEDWKKSFLQIPFFSNRLILFESLPNLNYQILQTWEMDLPFEEIEHTADRAYLIRGETVEDIYHHAFCALAFYFPHLLQFQLKAPTEEHDLVPILNQTLAEADLNLGCPFKAVSYHGNISQKNGYYEWEMIVDV